MASSKREYPSETGTEVTKGPGEQPTAPETPEQTEQAATDGNDFDPSVDAYDPKSSEGVSHDENANVAKGRADRSPVGVTNEGPVGAFVDGVTRRSAAEVMQGHFCSVDRTADGVENALEEVGANSDRDGYGVYIEPAETDEQGYPKTALVRLRDDTHALISVPYTALRPANAGGR